MCEAETALREIKDLIEYENFAIHALWEVSALIDQYFGEELGTDE